MLFNLMKQIWLCFSTYWKKIWLCFSTCWKKYGYAFQPVEKILAMLFNFWKVILYEFQVSEKFSWMVFRAWKVQKSLTVTLLKTQKWLFVMLSYVTCECTNHHSASSRDICMCLRGISSTSHIFHVSQSPSFDFILTVTVDTYLTHPNFSRHFWNSGRNFYQ